MSLNPSPPGAYAQDRPRPQSPADLFWSFTWLALQGFGGVVAVVQRELVEKKRWMTNEEFLEDWAVAQVMPGPNVVNLSLMIGDRFFGWRGACAALGGMMALPMTVMLLLAWAVAQAPEASAMQGAIKGALGGIAAVAAGQVIGTVLKLAAPLRQHPLSWPACIGLAAAAFAMMAWLHWSLVWVLFGLGSLACVWTYVVLQRARASS